MDNKMDLRLQKTYLALQSAFTQLLEEKRFDELTVNELCDRAMIRRSTFYKHFMDKYDYFAFYIREMVSTLQHHLPADVAVWDVNTYILYKSREMHHFLHLHKRMVCNIKNSSLFPMLLSILLDQITGDIRVILQRICPVSPEGSRKQEAIAAFYAGGVLNCYFRLMQEDATVDEALFFDVIKQMTKQMLY